jgi:hypothetical protein
VKMLEYIDSFKIAPPFVSLRYVYIVRVLYILENEHLYSVGWESKCSKMKVDVVERGSETGFSTIDRVLYSSYNTRIVGINRNKHNSYIVLLL